eukprot:4457632-Prymnesium_polylepis.1
MNAEPDRGSKAVRYGTGSGGSRGGGTYMSGSRTQKPEQDASALPRAGSDVQKSRLRVRIENTLSLSRWLES